MLREEGIPLRFLPRRQRDFIFLLANAHMIAYAFG